MVSRLVTWSVLVLLLEAVGGCTIPIGVYHDIEGGAIAQRRQAPPGADLPYPNLASIPQTPKLLTPVQQAAVNRRIAGTSPAVSPASPGALAGLELPAAPPPLPNVPGLPIPTASAPPAPVLHKVAKKLPAPSAPVELAFTPGSAVLSHKTAVALFGVALGRGVADIEVGGFGEAAGPGDAAALRLAVARARRLADQLTADGVPAKDIRMVAAAGGSGGFVRLDY
jgi:hypothetical protein